MFVRQWNIDFSWNDRWMLRMRVKFPSFFWNTHQLSVGLVYIFNKLYGVNSQESIRHTLETFTLPILAIVHRLSCVDTSFCVRLNAQWTHDRSVSLNDTIVCLNARWERLFKPTIDTFVYFCTLIISSIQLLFLYYLL